MTNKEHVLKYGGKFSISGGEVWTMPMDTMFISL